MDGHRSQGNVCAGRTDRHAQGTGRGGENRCRRHHEETRGAQDTVRHGEVHSRLGPYGPFGLMDLRGVTGLLRLLSNLSGPMLGPVQTRAGHAPHEKDREQEPDQNGTALVHGPDGSETKARAPIATPAAWFHG
jgi:hypothetical protein